jgi:hypothetical protein
MSANTNHIYSTTTNFYFYFLGIKDGIRLKNTNPAQLSPAMVPESLLAVLKPNRIIHKRMYANCSSFHLIVFLRLSNPQGQRQTSTLSIPRDNFGERKAKFNQETRTTQMLLYKCIDVP